MMNDFIAFQRHVIAKRIIRHIEEVDGGISIATDDENLFFSKHDLNDDVDGAMIFLLRMFNED